MRIHFVNRFYRPDETATAQLLTDLAEAAASWGCECRVIASRPEGAAAAEEAGGVRVERVGGPRRPERGLAAKAGNYSCFAAAALGRLARSVGPGDTVIALTDPPLIGVGAAAIARRRGARMIHWIQDIYPEVALALGGPRALGLLRPWRDRAWRGADACVTLGRDMAAVVARAGVPPERIFVIPNWPPAGLGPPDPARVSALRRAWGLEGRLAVLYSGNLGRVHELDTVLEAASALAGEPDIAFVFVGGGARRAALEAEVARRGRAGPLSVSFQPAQARGDLAEVLAAADAHLVTLRAGCERYVYPSKLSAVAAAGRPVLFVGPPDSEPARLVLRQGIGRVFAPGEAAALAGCLRRWRGDPSEPRRLAAAAAALGGADGLALWRPLLQAGRRPAK